jgi:hypothetical protein
MKLALGGSVTVDSYLVSVFWPPGCGTMQIGAQTTVLPGDKIMFDEQLLNSNFASEQDFRLAVLNSLLRTPHRNVTPFVPLFSRLQEKDPLFFSRLAAWYFDNGTVHDLKQLFIALLCISNFDESDREAGLAMLHKLPPYQVERVLRMLKGYRSGETYMVGIAKSIPRSFRTAIEQYLRDREADERSFDSSVLHAKKSMKTLYATFRIKPGPYAQKILFDETPPEGSKAAILKEIARAESPTDQARLIVENKIPYRIAVSLIKQMTPAALVSIVNSMTPQEVINNLSSLKKRGALDDADLRKLIESKLEAGKTDKRVSALKTREALKVAGVDAEMTKIVEDIGNQQIKAKGTIKRSTALLVDKSGSMTQAIEVGKLIASMIAPICEAGLYVYAFDNMSYDIKAKGNGLADWERAFKGIVAAGNTSCGVCVEVMRKRKQKVEQIVIVTDQGDNAQPLMHEAVKKYADDPDMNGMPSVIIVHVGNPDNSVEKNLMSIGCEVDVYSFAGDYYSLPALVPMLARGTKLELLMEIMAGELPVRERKAELVGSGKS